MVDMEFTLTESALAQVQKRLREQATASGAPVMHTQPGNGNGAGDGDQDQQPTADQVSGLLDAESVDENARFRILAVDWNFDEKEICVDYYDVAENHKAGRTHAWFEERVETDNYGECEPYLCISRVWEVEEWVELYYEQLQQQAEVERT